MRRRLAALALCCAGATAAAAATPAEVRSVRVSVKGPAFDISFLCELPCELERLEDVGRREATSVFTVDDEEVAADRGRRRECVDECRDTERKQVFTIRPGSDLVRGYGFKLDRERGQLVLHDVVDVVDGATNRRRMADFRFDRLPLKFFAHEHDIVIEAAEPEGG